MDSWAVMMVTFLVAVAAMVDIYVAYSLPVRARYVSKALIAGILIVVALTAAAPVSRWYQGAVVVGLLCSLVGDLFLIRETRRFMYGIGSFFVAHLFYSAAFISQEAMPRTGIAVALVAVYLIVFIRLLWPHIKGVRIAVIAYSLVLALMALLAVEMAIGRHVAGATFAAVGAVLFVISDSVLACDHFVRSLPGRTIFVMLTYAAAQLLITVSVFSW